MDNQMSKEEIDRILNDDVEVIDTPTRTPGWQKAVDDKDMLTIDKGYETVKNYLPDTLFAAFSNLSGDYREIIMLKLQGVNNADIARRKNCTPANITYYCKRPAVKSIIDFIEIEKIKTIRNEIVEKTTGGLKTALDELIKLIENVKDPKIKLEAIRVMLNYDSSANITHEVQTTALTTNLL